MRIGTTSCLLLLRRDHHHHLATFETRETFDHRVIDDIALDALDHRLAQFHVRHLASLEPDRNLDLIALFQEPPQVAHLDVVVALFCRGAKLQLFDLDLLGLALGRVRFLLLLELEFAEIHDAADRRVGHRLNFDQIQAGVCGHFQRIFARQDSYLLTVRADYTHPRTANFRILAVSFFSGDNSTLHQTRLNHSRERWA